MIMRLTKEQLIPALLLLAVATTAIASGRPLPPRPPAPPANSCESNIALLDVVHAEAGAQGSIIAVARLGKGERSRSLNHRRLYNLRTYLEKFNKRPRETIVVAEGERVNSRGRIEVYVAGKLQVIFEFGRGEDLHVGSCDASSRLDILFYDSRNRSGRGVYVPPHVNR